MRTNNQVLLFTSHAGEVKPLISHHNACKMVYNHATGRPWDGGFPYSPSSFGIVYTLYVWGSFLCVLVYVSVGERVKMGGGSDRRTERYGLRLWNYKG